MRKAFGAVVALAACAAAAGVLWVAGEQHYRGCVLAAEVQWPVVAQPEASDFMFSDAGSPASAADAAGTARRRRAQALDECSRIPL